MQDEFHTHLSVPGFVVSGGQRRTATLHLGELGLRVEADRHDGETIRWRAAALKKDEADDAILVIDRHLTVGSTDAGFLRAIEGAAGNDLDRQLAQLQGLPTGWKGSQWVGCLVFFAVSIWAIVSMPGCYRSAVDSTVDSLPYEVDESLGEQAQDAMEPATEIEDDEVVAAIEAMVERLAPQFEGTDVPPGRVEWHVRVIESSELNAFALPGGYITVYTELIRKADSPDMVAGIIGHEMAHVLQRHGLRRIANQIGLLAGVRLIFGDSGGLVGIAGEVLTIATANQYGQAQETEADLLGTQALVRAGLEPEALAEFFQLLESEYGDIPAGLSWLSTHPGHATRTDAIRAIVADMDAPAVEPLDVDWRDIQERVGASASDASEEAASDTRD